MIGPTGDFSIADHPYLVLLFAVALLPFAVGGGMLVQVIFSESWKWLRGNVDLATNVERERCMEGRIVADPWPERRFRNGKNG